MSKNYPDSILTGTDLQFFYQVGGASPYNPMKYAGVEGQTMTIEEVSAPARGGKTPINVQDPLQRGLYKQQAATIEAPEFPSADIMFREDLGGVGRSLMTAVCPNNYYMVTGKCNSLSVFNRQDYQYIRVLQNGQVTDQTWGGRAFDGADALVDTLSNVFDAAYHVGALFFGEEAATDITFRVADVVYGSQVECGDCGTERDGTDLVYSLVLNDTGVAPSVVALVEGNATQVAITGAADTDTPEAIEVMSNNTMLVITNDGTDTTLWIADINRLTGIPENWRSTQTGFVSTNIARDIFVESPRAIYFAADNGYIYKAVNPLTGVTVTDAANATTSNLTRIHGAQSTLVAVGVSGTVVYSLNQGESWAATLNAAGAADLTGISVSSRSLWYATGVDGVLYYNKSQGALAWDSQQLLSSAATDIVFASLEVGYIFGFDGAVPVLYHTENGGETWNRITSGLGDFVDTTRIAVPCTSIDSINVNAIALAGEQAASDGLLVIGEASIVG